MIIFCCSNLTLPSVLSLISKNKQSKELLIFTTNKSVYQILLDLFDKENVFYFELPAENIPNSLKRLFLHPFKSIQAIFLNIKSKKYFKSLSNERIKENADVYFELYVFCDFEFWMVSFLKNKTKNYFFLKNLHSIKTSDIKWIDKIVYSFFNKIIFNTKLEPCIASGSSTMKLTNSYLDSLGATTINNLYDKEAISNIVNEKISEVANTDVIILTGGLVCGSFVKNKSYLFTQNEIINGIVLSKKTIAVKSHPVYVDYIGLENNLNKIPSYIPFNILDLNSYKVIIGLTSTVLIEVSNNSKCKAISTLEIYKGEYIKEEFYDEFKHYLYLNMDKENPILFPKTITELLDIISIC